MPKDPVNLTHLREITGGDTGMEKELFTVFLESGQECIDALAQHCADGENETWRKQAHALKGSALNMGAEALAEICKQAQESSAISGKEKKALLQKIQGEYKKVQDFLRTV